MLKVTVISFSFKRGIPGDPTGNGNAPGAEGDQVGRMSEANEPRSGRKSPHGFVFDCRAMPNPFWDETLRGYTGCDKPVCDFSVYFDERMAERLSGIEDVEIRLKSPTQRNNTGRPTTPRRIVI